jgi:uncharacterized protein YndB with AHSA1/START domain
MRIGHCPAFWNAETEMSTPIAKSELLVNASPATVFAAFCDKQTICNFWLDHATGDLAPNAKVEWTFMVPGAKETVQVLAFKQSEYIKYKWSDGSVVEISFKARTENSTRVSVAVSNLSGDDPVATATDATEGFAIVLCDLKSLLETGKSGGMVRDKALLIAEDMSSG